MNTHHKQAKWRYLFRTIELMCLVQAYVTQEDVLLGTLTVRETIKYSAQLRLPTKMSKDEVNSIVEGTIIEMGLQDCADRVIGNWHLRGISGGEKKRLSIALEILTRPHLLFLDEPTSGLDSASAFFVVQTLRNIARDGRTVISSIHQPSSEVFALFDDLYLLSSGETVYFGEAKMAVEVCVENSTEISRSIFDGFIWNFSIAWLSFDLDVSETILNHRKSFWTYLSTFLYQIVTEYLNFSFSLKLAFHVQEKGILQITSYVA